MWIYGYISLFTILYFLCYIHGWNDSFIVFLGLNWEWARTKPTNQTNKTKQKSSSCWFVLCGVIWTMNQPRLFNFTMHFVGHGSFPLLHCTMMAGQLKTQGAFKFCSKSTSSVLLWCWSTVCALLLFQMTKGPGHLVINHKVTQFITNFDSQCGSCPFLV